MRVALVLPGSIWYAPYVRIYTRILQDTGVEHSIISWNREGDDKPEGYQYNKPCANGHGSAGLKEYIGYIRFIKETIKEQAFERIIVFGPQMTCLLSLYLLVHFRGRYMIDYRDLSIEQKPGFKQLFALMLKHSRVNVISSPGFKRCLPKQNYYLSHNFDVDAVRSALSKSIEEDSFNVNDTIDILTIGAIRDYASNVEVVKALANKNDVKLRFVGKGDAADRISDYCKTEGILNVSFTGYYHKSEEARYIKSATFMNIFYPRIITHDTAMSNRFYNSLIYKKPMIVTKGTTQGDYVEQNRLGLSLSDCDSLYEQLISFIREENYNVYAKRCNSLLRMFLKDQEAFETAIKGFVEL